MAEPVIVPRMAEKQNSHKVPYGCSAEQLQGIVHLAQLACAQYDPIEERITWCTPDWLKAYPSLGVGACWTNSASDTVNETGNEAINGAANEATNIATNEETREAVENEFNKSKFEELEKLYNSLKGKDSVSASLRCELSNVVKKMSIYRQPDEMIVLLLSEPSVVSQEPDATDMHLYMQARESMFTTSRTISVSEMATTLAHEIKQPIATITNILKGVRIRLGKSDVKDEMMETALEKALEQAEFTDSVINRIRDFTQARRPKQQVLDMGEILNESLSLMDWFLSANHCDVQLRIGDGPLFCDGDPTMLQQVIANLVRNGVEAMQERSAKDRQLLVECQRQNESVRISIKDSGHGLKIEEKTLFVPFTTSKANGMGVGLNICRSFVELHQGRLWLSPNKEGGCTSHIELPQAAFSVGQTG